MGLHLTGLLKIPVVIYFCYGLMWFYNNEILKTQFESDWDAISQQDSDLPITNNQNSENEDGDFFDLDIKFKNQELQNFYNHLKNDPNATKLVIYLV